MDAAIKGYADEKINSVVNQLGAFTNEVQAQRGKKIKEAAADDLIAQAQFIIATLSIAPTPALTLTPTLVNTETPLPTFTFTPTFTEIPSPTFTLTPSLTPTETLIPTETFTPLPTATEIPPVGPLTIDYTYDALHRLKNAVYSDGRSFSYVYDTNGNTLEAKDSTATTTYTYDAANQLVTAQSEDATWNYVYDGNGSLIKVLPNGSESNGAKRYTYNAAGYLVKVEAHDENSWNIQAEMNYDGMGARLTTSANGITSYYALDGQLPLTVSTDGKVITILYGREPIAEKTDEWNYVLSDSTGTPRQLTDIDGHVTLSIRYSPWGKPIDTDGVENFDASYVSSLVDFSTGLMYIGNGQYYDPETGRFLTRGANPNSPNPYVPWNPLGVLLAPLALASVISSRKKVKGKKLKGIAAVSSLSLFLAACWKVAVFVGIALFLAWALGGCTPKSSPPPENPNNGSPTAGPTTVAPVIPSSTATPTSTVTPPPPCCGWLDKPFLITHYVISLESDTLFDGCWNCWPQPANIPMSESPGGAINYNHSYKNAFVYGRCDTQAQCKADPPQAYWGVYQEGTGYTLDGRYITQDGNQLTDKGKAVFTFVDKPKPACADKGYFAEIGKTVATSKSNLLADEDFGCGKKYYIEDFEGVFTIVDSGTDVGSAQFDIYVGETTKAAFDATYTNTHTKHRVAPAP